LQTENFTFSSLKIITVTGLENSRSNESHPCLPGRRTGGGLIIWLRQPHFNAFYAQSENWEFSSTQIIPWIFNWRVYSIKV